MSTEIKYVECGSPQGGPISGFKVPDYLNEDLDSQNTIKTKPPKRSF